MTITRQGPSAPGQTSLVLDFCEEAYNTGTTVGTTATAIPATNRARRKGISIQNLDSSADAYVAAAKPISLKSETYRNLWAESETKAGEYYLAAIVASTSPIDQTLQLYSKLKTDSDEVKRTAGTIGSLTANTWVWGNNDGLGYDTLYVCPPTGMTPDDAYTIILSYARMPATSGASAGFKLGPTDSIYIPISGATRVFAISSSGNITVLTLEYA